MSKELKMFPWNTYGDIPAVVERLRKQHNVDTVVTSQASAILQGSLNKELERTIPGRVLVFDGNDPWTPTAVHDLLVFRAQCGLPTGLVTWRPNTQLACIVMNAQMAYVVSKEVNILANVVAKNEETIVRMKDSLEFLETIRKTIYDADVTRTSIINNLYSVATGTLLEYGITVADVPPNPGTVGYHFRRVLHLDNAVSELRNKISTASVNILKSV